MIKKWIITTIINIHVQYCYYNGYIIILSNRRPLEYRLANDQPKFNLFVNSFMLTLHSNNYVTFVIK